MDEELELSKMHWYNFLYWYEEKHGELLRLPMMSSEDVMTKDSETYIASRTYIPEKYYVVKKHILGTPWERYTKEIVTMVTP